VRVGNLHRCPSSRAGHAPGRQQAWLRSAPRRYAAVSRRRSGSHLPAVEVGSARGLNTRARGESASAAGLMRAA
jgi:hypothetical protein